MPRPLTPPRLRIRRPPGSEQDLRELVNYLEELDAFLATAFPNMHMDAQRAMRQSGDRLDEHINDLDNPHQVTPQQIGAETPAGAQSKADSAKADSKSYTDTSLATHKSSGDHDERYDGRYVNKAGDVMADSLKVGGDLVAKALVMAYNDIDQERWKWKYNGSSGAAELLSFDGENWAVRLATSNRNNPEDHSLYANGQHKIWHDGNDGSGSGLDADLLDGQHASHFASQEEFDTAIGNVENELDGVSQTLDAVKNEVTVMHGHLYTHHHDDRYFTQQQLTTSGGGGQVHWNNITSKPIPLPVTQLKKAQGSYQTAYVEDDTESYEFDVNQYAFASPSVTGYYDERYISTAITDMAYTSRFRPPGIARKWRASLSTSEKTRATFTWDYLTASGHPRVWAEVDDQGEIHTMWEAEDPADPDFPDEPPFEPGEGRVVIPILVPDEWAISAIRDRLTDPPQSEWLTKSRFASQVDPVSILRTMYDEQLRERGLEIPDDIRAVFTDISDYDLRHWYLQLWLRQASRLLHNHRPSTMCPLYCDAFRVDRATGALIIK